MVFLVGYVTHVKAYAFFVGTSHVAQVNVAYLEAHLLTSSELVEDNDKRVS